MCARPEPAGWRTVGGLTLSRCRRCGFAWFPRWQYARRPVEVQYLEDSTSPVEYYRAAAAHDLETFSIRVKKIVRLTGRAGGRLLDVGCNVGTFLEAARQHGWSAVGVEPNPRAAAHARARGFEVHTGVFDENLAPRLGRFDAVHLGDVIEHVFEPVALLRCARAALRPGGLLLAVTPDVDSLLGRLLQIKPDEHLVYFTRDALRRAGTLAGFQRVVVERWRRRRSMAAMRHSTTFAPATRRLVALLAAPGLRPVVEHGLYRLFPDELLLTAVRPEVDG